MGYRIQVDFDLCESNAICMQIAPEVFEVRDDDFLYILNEEPGEDLKAQVEEAAQSAQAGNRNRRGLTTERNHCCRGFISWTSLLRHFGHKVLTE